MVNADILERLQNARRPKEKKAPATSKEKADKRKAEEAANKAAGLKKGRLTFKRKGGRSEKMKGIMAAIKPLYKSFLKEKPICEIKSAVCTSEATCIHHTAGRGMDHLMDTNSWEAACSACNGYVEKNDRWARDNGHKVSRLSNQSTNK